MHSHAITHIDLEILEALKIRKAEGRAFSITWVQWKFKVGYEKAKRAVELFNEMQEKEDGQSTKQKVKSYDRFNKLK